MKNMARTLMIVGALATAARADTLVPFKDDDWTAAAQASLAIVARNRHPVVVLDDALSPAARIIFSHMAGAVARDALPEQDKYILPPGDYLLVRKFEPQGGQFEFTATRGVIPRGAMRNCGVTEDFFVAKDPAGAWKVVGPTTEIVC